FFACQRTPPEAPPTPSASATPRVSLPARERGGAVDPSFDVGAVVEQVSHHLEEDPAQPGGYRALDRDYLAQFRPGAFSFTPRGENEDVFADPGAICFRSLGLSLSAAPAGTDLGEPSLSQEENRVVFLWSSGLSERYEMKSGAVIQSWTLADPLPGEGDL